MKFGINKLSALIEQIDLQNLHRFSGEIKDGELAQQKGILAVVDRVLMTLFHGYGEKRAQKLLRNCFQYARTHQVEGDATVKTLKKVEDVLSQYFKLKATDSNKELYRLIEEKTAETTPELTMEDFPKVSPAPKGTDLNQKLLDALIAGDFTKMREAVLQGAKVNEKDALGFTPLHYAVASGQVNNVYFLLQRGAKPNSKGNVENLSPFDIALKNQSNTMIHLMIAAGAKVTKSTLGKIEARDKNDPTLDQAKESLAKKNLQTKHKNWRAKFFYALPKSWSEEDRNKVANLGVQYVEDLKADLIETQKLLTENGSKEALMWLNNSSEETMNARNAQYPKLFSQFYQDMKRDGFSITLKDKLNVLSARYDQVPLLAYDALIQACPSNISSDYLQKHLHQGASAALSGSMIAATVEHGAPYQGKLLAPNDKFVGEYFTTYQVQPLPQKDKFLLHVQTQIVITVETENERYFVDQFCALKETLTIQGDEIVNYRVSVKK